MIRIITLIFCLIASVSVKCQTYYCPNSYHGGKVVVYDDVYTRHYSPTIVVTQTYTVRRRYSPPVRRVHIVNNPYGASYYQPIEDYSGYTCVGQMKKTNWRFYFNIDSYELIDIEELGRLISYAKEHPYCNLYFDAYADVETGTSDYNMNLSRNRAYSIVNILINEGIDYNRLHIKANGSSVQPYRTNELNRCVFVTAVE